MGTPKPCRTPTICCRLRQGVPGQGQRQTRPSAGAGHDSAFGQL